MKSRIFIIMMAFVAVSLATTLASDRSPYGENSWMPHLVNYQGVLTDSAGNRLTGIYQMTLSIYNDSTDGTLLWTEVHESVECSCGIFNVELGSVDSIPIEVFSRRNRWLGVKVEGDLEMTPRQRLTSVGYAYHAGYAGIGYHIKAYVGPRYVEIPIPHYTPFQIMLSELGGYSDKSAWMSGGENDNQLSYVGIDGNGNVVHGTASLGSVDTILTVRTGLVLRTKGDDSHVLILDSSGYDRDSRAVILTPRSKPVED